MEYSPFFDHEKLHENSNKIEKRLSEMSPPKNLGLMKEEKTIGKIPKNLEKFHPATKLGKLGKKLLTNKEVYQLMLRLKDV